MDQNAATLELRIERTIAASPEAAYDAWLDPKVPGTPWNFAGKIVMDVKEDGLFFARMKTTPHYGMFTSLVRGTEIRHTWMSPHTQGQESVVTVSFERQGDDTLMRLVHTGLPDSEKARAHQEGWTFFVDGFAQQFAGAAGA